MTTLPGPGVAVTVTGPTDPAFLRAADVCEVRADLWRGPRTEAMTFLRHCPKPVIFTCRIPEEGGQFRGDDAERINLFTEALDAGADLLDVEARSTLAPRALRTGWPVLLSMHDFSGMIPDLPDRLRQMAADGATAAKIVPTARTTRDLLAIRSILQAPQPIPVAAFAMGEVGIPSRILALAWGSRLTYLAAGETVAPGQLSLDRFIGTFPSVRSARRHVALVATADTDVDELLDLARTANEALGRIQSQATATCVVPYPAADLNDLRAILSELGALGLLVLGHRQDAGTSLTVYRTPSTHSVDALTAKTAQDLAAMFQRALSRLTP
jgi:3-dehydroquinate dehydratase type I